MLIDPTMDLSELGDRMSPESTTTAEQAAMRDALLAAGFEGTHTQDVPEAEWERLLEASCPRDVLAPRFWLVSDGEASEIDEESVHRVWSELADNNEDVIAYAASEAAALALAVRYDAGQIGIDNLTRNGVTIGCLR